MYTSVIQPYFLIWGFLKSPCDCRKLCTTPISKSQDQNLAVLCLDLKGEREQFYPYNLWFSLNGYLSEGGLMSLPQDEHFEMYMPPLQSFAQDSSQGY